MGVHNKARRQAKAKDRQRQIRSRGAASHPRSAPRSPDSERVSQAETVAQLSAQALTTIYATIPAVTNPNVRALAELYDSDDQYANLVDIALVGMVGNALNRAWQSGWQPADVARMLRRKKADVPLAMAADCMAAQLSTFAPTTVDERFRSQLATLGSDPDGGAVAGFVGRWMRRTGADPATVIGGAIELAHTVAFLPRLEPLCPPPGDARWALQPRPGTTVDTKLLERVRALLAKAESSEYGAEADSFTAKAQELMVRHSIDHALLIASAGDAEEPGGVRVGIDNPYEAEKALLLDRVAQANRCKAIWSRGLGFVTVLGYPADLRAVELLYTSLLVQATRAMLREGSRKTIGGGSRTRSFRLAFLSAFATRIGQRLTGVTESGLREGAAEDARLLPVLAGRDRAVGQLGEKLFPNVTYENRSLQAYDREGWTVGTHTADLASLAAIPSIADDAPPDSPMLPVEAAQEALFPVPDQT